MYHPSKVTGTLAALLLLAGCGPPPENPGANTGPESPADAPNAMRQITGAVSYRERIALSPQAELTVQLRDVSRADAPAEVVAELVIQDPGQVPIDFALEYDPAQIVERNSYSMHAVIREGETMRFITDTVYPVLTRGNGDLAIMTLVQVSPAATKTPAANLIDTQWILKSIDGEAISIRDDQRPASLQLSSDNNIVQGFSGCNQFSGSWSQEEQHITFGPLAMTMMACAENTDTERAFMQALDGQNRYEIRDNELLMYRDDQVVLVFYPSE